MLQLVCFLPLRFDPPLWCSGSWLLGLSPHGDRWLEDAQRAKSRRRCSLDRCVYVLWVLLTLRKGVRALPLKLPYASARQISGGRLFSRALSFGGPKPGGVNGHAKACYTARPRRSCVCRTSSGLHDISPWSVLSWPLYNGRLATPSSPPPGLRSCLRFFGALGECRFRLVLQASEFAWLSVYLHFSPYREPSNNPQQRQLCPCQCLRLVLPLLPTTWRS